MKRRRPIRTFVVAGAIVGFVGCAASNGSGNPGEDHGMGKPFMIREASLPEGFPAPGPVGTVIIKDYPAYRMARVSSNGGKGTDGMFGPLFNHIKRNKIAMTAPVEIGYSVSGAELASSKKDGDDVRAAESMAFLYGEPSMGRTGSDSADSRVKVEDVPAMTVLSIGVRGSYTDEHFAKALKKLQSWLVDNPGKVRVVGPPRYLGYNSPFVLWFLRYAEVQLPVERIKQTVKSGGEQPT